MIVEVRVVRRPSRDSYYHPHTSELGYIDGYVRYFLLLPGAGWRDYLGRYLVGREIVRTSDAMTCFPSGWLTTSLRGFRP